MIQEWWDQLQNSVLSMDQTPQKLEESSKDSIETTKLNQYLFL